MLRPASTAEVAALVTLANVHGIALVPQGGNTGLAGGATPDASGGQAVLSLARLNRVRALDPHNNTITVEAGVILADVQARARDAGRLFALSLAAEGSCTIGGNLATNAGGTAVLRYGNARELCLGLEVVTPQGEIWDGLRGLRKDNTGYDLRDLFIGAEGTLGIITAAVMKLHPQPAAQVTALAALDSPHAALDFLALAQRAAGLGAAGEFAGLAEAADKLRLDVDPAHDLHQATQALAGHQHEVVERSFDGAADPGLDRRRVRRVVDGEHRALQHIGALLGEQAGKLCLLARLEDQDAVAVQPVSHDGP